jgi:chloramphenicol 3-O phosphotransferase
MEECMPHPQIIIVNGVGSVGKTSTVRALQRVARNPLLHVAMDAFLDMLPEGMVGHPDGVVFETTQDAGHPCVVIKTGPVVKRLMHGMRHAIAAMAAQGNVLVVDDVITRAEQAEEYRGLLSQFELRFVGLFASDDCYCRQVGKDCMGAI